MTIAGLLQSLTNSGLANKRARADPLQFFDQRRYPVPPVSVTLRHQWDSRQSQVTKQIARSWQNSGSAEKLHRFRFPASLGAAEQGPQWVQRKGRPLQHRPVQHRPVQHRRVRRGDRRFPALPLWLLDRPAPLPRRVHPPLVGLTGRHCWKADSDASRHKPVRHRPSRNVGPDQSPAHYPRSPGKVAQLRLVMLHPGGAPHASLPCTGTRNPRPRWSAD